MKRASGIILSIFLCAVWLSGCASTPLEQTTRAVAVWDLENLSLSEQARPDLGQVLSGEIIQAIQRTGDIRVVERERLVTILEELKLGSSELADETTRLKVGRIIGAAEMVFGGYMVVGNTMRIDLRRVDVSTGRVLKTVKQTTGADDMEGWLKAAGQAGSTLYGRQ